MTDREHIIAASSGTKKLLLDKAVSRDLERMIDRRESVVASGAGKEYRKVCDEPENFAWEVICPIISEGDAIGGCNIYTQQRDAFGRYGAQISSRGSRFLGRQLEQ